MKRHILVVDDEDQIRDLLTLYFRRNDFEVSTSATAADTLAFLKDRTPDLIVMDIGLNEDDGLKLLAAVKNTYPTIKVIMLTGMGFVEELLLESQQKGADGYVSKVMPLEELMAQVRSVLK
jgi:DNA-binding response OmpR family regulator